MKTFFDEVTRDKLMHRILDVLLNSDATAYQIEKKTGIPHATVHKKIRQALKENLIKVKAEEIFRTGLPTKTYELTLKGLMAYLAYYSSYQFIRRLRGEVINETLESETIVKKTSEKVTKLLYKNWQKFLNYVSEKYAESILTSLAQNVAVSWENCKPEDIERLFFMKFMSKLRNPPKDAPLEGVMAFLKTELELKKMVVEYTNKEIELLKSRIEELYERQKKLQDMV